MIRKRPVVAAVERVRGRDVLAEKACLVARFKPEQRQECNAFPILPPGSSSLKKATVLLEQWVKDVVVQLAFLEVSPSQANRRHTKYYPYHRKKWHTLEHCSTFQRIFDRKL